MLPQCLLLSRSLLSIPRCSPLSPLHLRSSSAGSWPRKALSAQAAAPSAVPALSLAAIRALDVDGAMSWAMAHGLGQEDAEKLRAQQFNGSHLLQLREEQLFRYGVLGGP